MCGIYIIKNTVSQRVYVGQTGGSFEKRWSQHTCALNKNNHVNKVLQDDWNAFGSDAFVFQVAQELSNRDGIVKFEKMWIDKFEETYNTINRTRVRELGREKIRLYNIWLKVSGIERWKAWRLAKSLIYPDSGSW